MFINIGLNVIGKFLSTILYVVGYIGSLLAQLAAQLVNWALNLNYGIQTSALVKAGWLITRDIANLGFVLAIIVIAFTTIFRIKEYDTKKMLTNLIVAALLINFSLVITGVFIDLSGNLTHFFISKATGGSASSLSLKLANAFNVQAFLQPTSDPDSLDRIAGGLTSGFKGWPIFIGSLFFVAFFTAITALSIGSLAIMLTIRYVSLTILIILMPLAWLTSVFPTTAKYWSEWWSNFLKWIFFAPAMSFFIYLAIYLVEATGVNNNFSAVQGLFVGSSLQENVGGIVGQMIAVTGILLGGLMAADRMGIKFASTALSGADWLKGTFITKPGKAIGGAIGGAALGALYSKGEEGKDNKPGKPAGGGLGRLQNKLRTSIGTAGADSTQKGAAGAPFIQRVANTFAGIPGAEKMVTGLSKMTQYPKQSIEEFEKMYDKWTPDMIKAKLQNTTLLSNTEAAALTNKAMTSKDPIADKAVFETLSDELKKYYLENSKKLGNTGKILAARPDMAPGIMPDDEKTPTATAKIFAAIRKNLKVKETAKTLSPEALKAEGYDVFLGLDVNHLANIEKDAESFELKDAILKKFDALRKDIKDGKIKLDDEDNKKKTRFSVLEKRLLYGPLWLNQNRPNNKNRDEEEEIEEIVEEIEEKSDKK